MQFKKIKSRMIFTILPVVFISTTALALVSYFTAYTKINAETSQKMFALLDMEVAEIMDELNQNAFVAKTLAHFAVTAKPEYFTSEAVDHFTGSAIHASINTIGGGIWFEPGSSYPNKQYLSPSFCCHADHQCDCFRQLFDDAEDNYFTAGWFLEGKHTDGQLFWTDIIFEPVSGITMVKAVQPMLGADGKFLGVCTANMNIHDIRRIIWKVEVGRTGEAFILSQSGAFITEGFRSLRPDFLITEHPDAQIAMLGNTVMQTASGEAAIPINGVKYRIYYKTMPQTGWKLVLKIDESEIYMSIKSLTVTTLLVTLLALGLMTLVIWGLVKYLHDIINKINIFSTRAAAGHFEERITLNTSDEFAGIADNLNVMLENMNTLSKAKGYFLSSMSHEIRTPMNAILGMAQIGKISQNLEKRGECLERIEENSNHMLGILNDILDYSKIQSGKLVLDKDWLSIRQNMDFVASMLRPKVQDKQLECNLNLSGIQHDGIMADALRLNQVLINLISNAIKFTPEGGRIDVTVEEKYFADGEAMYYFVVQDTGIGISAEQAQKLFTPFTQANAKISSSYGGTGLGLAISKNIVEMMGGEIGLDSTPGQGSTFSFTIRAAARETLPYKAPADNAPQSGLPDFHGRRFLIVDDIDINRQIMLELLQPSNAAMDTAENGAQALEMYLKAPEGHYDLVLMDMQMPVMDGCTATEHIRASGRGDANLKIVAMTANVMQHDVQRTLKAGMDGHIGKPVNMDELFAVLKAML